MIEVNQYKIKDAWFHKMDESAMWEPVITKEWLGNLYPFTTEERNYGKSSSKDNDLNIKEMKDALNNTKPLKSQSKPNLTVVLWKPMWELKNIITTYT